MKTTITIEVTEDGPRLLRGELLETVKPEAPREHETGNYAIQSAAQARLERAARRVIAALSSQWPGEAQPLPGKASYPWFSATAEDAHAAMLELREAVKTLTPPG